MENFKPRKLPPLNALKFVEAVAKAGSMNKAATYLNVSVSAVKQQIQLIESYLGKTIFNTNHQGTQLTEYGAHYLKQWSKALDIIEHSIDDKKEDVQSLTIDVIPSFLKNWLSKRLYSFQKQNPNINLFVHSSNTINHFKDNKTDLAIRYGKGDYPLLQAEILFKETVYAVASPNIIEDVRAMWQQKGYDKVKYLFDTPLLNDTMIEWDLWAKQRNLSVFNPKHYTTYSDTSNIIDAAIRGEGVMISRQSLLEDYLISGQLAKVEDIEYSMDTATYLVYPYYTNLTESAKLFRSWLLNEIK